MNRIIISTALLMTALAPVFSQNSIPENSGTAPANTTAKQEADDEKKTAAEPLKNGSTSPTGKNDIPEIKRGPWSITFSFANGITSLTDNQRAMAEETDNYENAIYTAGVNTPGLEDLSRFMLVTDGNLKKPTVPAWVNNSRFYAEYRPQHAGIAFGFSSVNYSYKRELSPELDTLAVTILNNTPQTSKNTMYQYLSSKKDKDEKSGDYNLNFIMLETAFSWHFKPKNNWDPFVHLGIKAGGGNNSAAAGIFTEAGLRYNFNIMFLHASVTRQTLWTNGDNHSARYDDTLATFGIGMFL